MRPLLVGEANPYQADPGLAQHYALYPDPPGCAGWRLCKLVMGLEPADYLKRFDRVNLCDGKWSTKEAKERAWALLGTRQELHTDRARCDVSYDMQRPLVLFGAKVARAFGQDFRPFTWQKVFDQKGLIFPTSHPIVTLPHTSGLSRAWNEPGAFERARAVLREAGVL